MSNQLQITGGAKVRSLEGVITGTSGVLSSVPLGGANGVATLDSGGKVPVSQLPSSVVTYLGTWNAATNTPTLTNGTGDAGDMYICNVAGTVNFGAGPITFSVGDWVLYGSGTWQKSNGQNGTVTSVGISTSANALTITNSPITTSGNIGVNFNGNSGQYVSGDGNLVTFPTIITEAQNLITDVYNETGATLTKGTVVYINGGHGNLPTVTKAIATSDATSAQTYGVVQADITNNNNGHVVVIGSLGDLDTQAYAAGTQLYLSSTTAGAWTSVKQYAPAHLVYVGIVVRSHPTQGVVEIKIQNGFELDELHNVSAQTPSNNDGLFYNSSNSLWENKSIATALGYTPANDALVVKLAGTQTITGSKTFSATTLLNTIYVDGVSYLKNQTTTSYIAGYTTFSAKANGVIEYYFPSSFKSILDFNDGGDYTYTFPSASGNLVLGSGSADQVAYWNSATGITYDSTFYYSASNKRLGVNTNTPNATIGANIAIDGGYGLLVKNADNNYNGLGIGIDSTYGNLIASQKLGTASARNVTILNQSGYHSLTEAGSFGLNILTPTASPSGVGSVGIDVYGGSNAAGIGFHNVASGVGNTNGAYIYLTNALSLTLRNLEGTIVSSSLGDFSVITNSTENFRVNASNGSLWQSNITNAVLKANSSNVIVAAVAGTDYQAPITLTTTGSSGAATFSSNTLNVPNYTLSGLGGVPTTRTLTINGTAYDLSADRSWSVGTLTGGGADGRVAFWNGASNVVSDSLFVWDDTNNRLGIGLVNPQRALEIYSSSPDTHLRLSGAAPSVSMGEAITGSIYQAKFGLATANNQFVTGSIPGDFVINNQTGSTIWAYNSTEKMRLDTNGNLGIGGTANSSYRLHVFGVAPYIAIESTTTSNTYLRMLQAGNTVGGMYYNNSDSTLRIHNNNGGLRFDTSTVNGAITVLSDGNVGIGATSTSYKLSVVGGNGDQLLLDNTGQRYTQISFNNNGILKSSIYWDNNNSLLTFSSAATFSSTITAGGQLSFSAATSQTAGSISRNSTFGLTLFGIAGSTYDFGLVNKDGTEVMAVPTGTQNAYFFGKVGIGTSSMSYAKFNVYNNTNDATYGAKIQGVFGPADYQDSDATQNYGSGTSETQFLAGTTARPAMISLGGNVNAGEAIGVINFFRSSNTDTYRSRAWIWSGLNTTGTANQYGGYLAFSTAADGATNPQERMRITSGGLVAVNSTSATYGEIFKVVNTGASANTAFFYFDGAQDRASIISTHGGSTGTTYRNHVEWKNSSGGSVGSVAVNGTTTAYNTTSDYRLKEDFRQINGLEKVSAIKVYDFKWKNVDARMDGVIAHELAQVLPYAVNGEKDGEKMQGVDYSKIVPVLVKAIQELKAEIDELKNK